MPHQSSQPTPTLQFLGAILNTTPQVNNQPSSLVQKDTRAEALIIQHLKESSSIKQPFIINKPTTNYQMPPKEKYVRKSIFDNKLNQNNIRQSVATPHEPEVFIDRQPYRRLQINTSSSLKIAPKSQEEGGRKKILPSQP